ncbi:MAG TPA: hypothetical protein VGC07_08020 [Granulicella sp.]
MDFSLLTNITQWAIWAFGGLAIMVSFVKKPPPHLAFFEKPLVLRLIIVLGIIFSGLNAYLSRSPKYVFIPLDQLELVEGKTFVNETVEVDGKFFDHCTFTNARFVVLGKHNSKISQSSFFGTLAIHTDSSEASAYAASLAGFGAIAQKDGRVSWNEEKDGKGFSVVIAFPPGATYMQNGGPR